MDYETALRASIDDEIAVAAALGAHCPIFGMVLLQPDGQLVWFNRAHKDFADTVYQQLDSKTIGVIGITTDHLNRYVNLLPEFEQHSAAFDELAAVVGRALPSEATLSLRRGALHVKF